MNFQIAEGGGELGVHQYLIIFLKFVQVFFLKFVQLGEASKKINCFFFRKTPKGGRGGLAQSESSLSEKTEIFLDFFSKRGGGLTYFKRVLS